MAASAVTDSETAKSPTWQNRLMSKHLSKRQLWRAKCVVGTFLFTNCVQFIVMNVSAQAGNCIFEW